MNIENDESKTIRNFIITLIIVLIVVVGVYFLTKYVVNKKETKESGNETQETTNYIDPSAAIVGTMLKKNAKKYYVLLTKSDGDNYSEYQVLISKYASSKNADKVYEVDLSNALNQKYVANNEEEINTSSDNINDLKFGEVTLLRIEDGKIVKSLTTKDTISKELNKK